jgi:uncharacterized protein (DUF4415 family)
MSKRIVKSRIDLANPPPLTPALQAELTALRASGNEGVDTSDIPPLTDKFWRDAVRNPFYRPKKTATTVRIDSDVMLWLRGQGRGYQTRINAILRRAMLEATQS